MHFHRLEPTLLTRQWIGEKTLFIHNDIQQQMEGKDGKNAILWKQFPQAYFALEKNLLKQFSQTFVCNTESVKFYQQRYPDLGDRFTYLKNAVDNEIFQPLEIEIETEKRKQIAKELNLPEQTRFILFAGRLHPQKDPLLLIRSFARLKQQDVHLLIAGTGELTEEISSEIKHLGLSGKITLLGAVNQSRLADLQRISRIFALTSLYEGLPVAVLEALASGTPVVTTPCGETPNFLTPDSGIVCRDREPETIAQALSQVLLNSEKYPVSACVNTAQPYVASTVVNTVYQQMWQRWQQKQNGLLITHEHTHSA
jgi:glycosyltransferase involved in cell wall biosynthesis